MAEPTSEDQVFAQLDNEKSPPIDTEQIKRAAVEAAKQSLIDSLAGKQPKYSWEAQGKAKPESYDELFSEVEKRTVKPDQVKDVAKEAAKEVLEEERQAALKAEEDKRKAELQTVEEKRKAFDRDWYDLVQKGKMPAVAADLQEKINKGEQLTKEEVLADAGLKARLDLAELTQRTNKPAKVAYYEDWDAQYAGAAAPVFGGRPATPQSSPDDYDYDEIAAERKRIYG